MNRISVVIPTYNRRKEVQEAVASVKAQSAAIFEIIVIDDGSTDGTSEDFADAGQPLRYVRTENRGVSAARNLGVSLAQGEWIAFLDSDDEWSADKLEKQLACVRETGARVCFTASENEDGERLDDIELMDPALPRDEAKYYPPEDHRLFAHPRHPFIQSALVERRALISAGLFDESLRVAEDTKLIYRLLADHGYAVVNEALVRICRKREEKGLSDQDDAATASKRYQCYARVQGEFYWQMLPRDPGTARILRSNHGYFLSRWAEIECVLGRTRLARTLGREAFFSGSGPKGRIRSLLIMMSPRVYRIFASRKWKH